MRRRFLAFRFVLASWLLLSAPVAAAQASHFEPQLGQAGKDAMWVPTPQQLVDRMLDMAKLTPNDIVIDLGSGDGRMVITAARRGARGVGIEYNRDFVELSKRNAAREGLGERAQFIEGDLFEADFSQATVITLFLLPDNMLRLRPRILELTPGTRVVSNSFHMGEWQDDGTFIIDPCNPWCVARLWIVPARVEGRWKTSAGDLTLGQQFQMLSGTLRTHAGPKTLNGKLLGDEIAFMAGGATYAGRVNGMSIEGTVTSGGNTSKWTATRTD